MGKGRGAPKQTKSFGTLFANQFFGNLGRKEGGVKVGPRPLVLGHFFSPKYWVN